MPKRKDMATQLGCDHGSLLPIRVADGWACRRWVSGFSFARALLLYTVFASFCSRVVFMSLTI